jgi:hypothetical protein
MEYKDGGRYEGAWVAGQRQGPGAWTAAEGAENDGGMMTLLAFDGNWEGDVAQGEGRGAFADGCEYEGNWKAGLPGGHGCLRYAGGEGEVRGIFEAGEIASGSETLSSGETYQGKFQKGKRGVRTGDAVVVESDGSVYVRRARRGEASEASTKKASFRGGAGHRSGADTGGDDEDCPT